MGRKKRTVLVVLSIFAGAVYVSLLLHSMLVPSSVMEGEADKRQPLRFLGGEVEIFLPASAAGVKDKISVRRKDDAPWGSVAAYDFRPDGKVFKEPVTVRFDLPDGALAAGMRPETLRVATLVDGRWKILKDARFDIEGRTIEIKVDHFSSYGLLSQPGQISDRGSRFELNGLVAEADAPVFGRLFVAPGFVSFYAEADSAFSVSLTLSGLPTEGDHYIYVNSHEEEYLLTPIDGGRITLPLDLARPVLVWIQPLPGTVLIGGGPDVDECESYGSRSGEVCTLETDLHDGVELISGTLDCSGHFIGQSALYGGSGIGVLVRPGSVGARLENCTIGNETAYFAYGIEALGATSAVLSNNTLSHDIIGILLQDTHDSHVTGNEITGDSLWAIALWDSTSGNEVSGNTIEVENDGIAIEGVVGAPSSMSNLISDNTITNGTGGILLAHTTDNTITGNDRSGGIRALAIGMNAWPNETYRNNFYGWSHWGVWSDIGPVELSHATYGGNWWGRSCPGPLFVPGVDSNRNDVVDSHAFGELDAWEIGISPGCGPTGDADGDGFPDDADNCPDWSNPGQENVDGISEGDACDVTPPPPPVIVSPLDGSIVSSALPIVLGIAERRSLVTIRVCPADSEASCSILGRGRAYDNGGFLVPSDLALPDGSYRIFAQSIDAAGNASEISNIVAITVATLPPEAPVITRPAVGEIATIPMIPVEGLTQRFTRVFLYLDGIDIGEADVYADGDFAFLVDGQAREGSNTLTAMAVDLQGRFSPPSSPVTFTLRTISETSSIEGMNGKMSITALEDRPDPFDPTIELSTLHVEVTTIPAAGLGGGSDNFRFETTLRWDIHDAGTGALVRSIDERFDVEQLIIDGHSIIRTSMTGAWDGRDSAHVISPPATLYTYDVSASLIREYVGPGRGPRCGRDETDAGLPGRSACIIDEAFVEGAGTVFVGERGEMPALAVPDLQVPTKFVGRGNAVAMDIEWQADNLANPVVLVRTDPRTLTLSSWHSERWEGGWTASESWWRSVMFTAPEDFVVHPDFDMSLDSSGNVHACAVYHAATEDSPYTSDAILVYVRGTKRLSNNDYFFEIYTVEPGSELLNYSPVEFDRIVRPFGCSIEVDRSSGSAEPVWLAFTGPALPGSDFNTAPWFIYIADADITSPFGSGFVAPLGYGFPGAGGKPIILDETMGTQLDLELDVYGSPHLACRGTDRSLTYIHYDRLNDVWSGEKIDPALTSPGRGSDEIHRYLRPKIAVIQDHPFIAATRIQSAPWEIHGGGIHPFRESDEVPPTAHIVLLARGQPAMRLLGEEPWHDFGAFFEYTVVENADKGFLASSEEEFEGFPLDIEITSDYGTRIAYVHQPIFPERMTSWNARHPTELGGAVYAAGNSLYSLGTHSSDFAYTARYALVDSVVERSLALDLDIDPLGQAAMVFGNDVEDVNQAAFIWERDTTFQDQESWTSVYNLTAHSRMRLNEEQLNMTPWMGADDFGGYLSTTEGRTALASKATSLLLLPVDQRIAIQYLLENEVLPPLATLMSNRQFLFSPDHWIDSDREIDVFDPVTAGFFNEVQSGLHLQDGYPPRKMQSHVCIPQRRDLYDFNLILDMTCQTRESFEGDAYSSSLMPVDLLDIYRSDEGEQAGCRYTTGDGCIGGEDSNGYCNPEILSADGFSCMTCDFYVAGSTTQGRFKPCESDDDCYEGLGYYCIDTGNFNEAMRNMFGDVFQLGFYANRRLCMKPLAACGQGELECPGECGTYRGIDSNYNRLEHACLVVEQDEDGNIVTNHNKLYPSIDHDAFECAAVGCTDCYRNAYCADDGDCPYGHRCETEIDVETPACVLRQVLDNDHFRGLEDGIRGNIALQALMPGVVAMLEDLRGFQAQVAENRIPKTMNIDDPDCEVRIGKIKSLEFRFEGDPDDPFLPGVPGPVDYRYFNKTGIHVVSLPPRRVMDLPLKSVRQQGEIWVVFDIDIEHPPYGIRASGWFERLRELSPIECDYGEYNWDWILEVPADPDEVEGLYVRLRYQPYVRFDNNGFGRMDLVYRGMEFLKSLPFEVFLTEQDLKDGLHDGYLISECGCVRDIVVNRVKRSLLDYIDDYFGGNVEGALTNTFNLLTTEPEISYLLFGQRCAPCTANYRVAGNSRHTVESVLLSGGLNNEYRFSYYDFSLRQDSQIEVLYRGENNCDPFIQGDTFQSVPPVVLPAEYAQWHADEGEMSYARAECAINALRPYPLTDPFSFEGCPEFCENGFDDDGDGLADCHDPDCASWHACMEICDNGIDDEDPDDPDNLVDCLDPECFMAEPCRENCVNLVDDNGNGLIDCDDPYCYSFPNCL